MDILAEAQRRGEQAYKEVISAFDRHDQEIEDSRKIARDVIYKAVLLSSSIVVFSVSLTSLDFLNRRINFTNLYFSWGLFLSATVMGLLIMFFEPRIKTAITWRFTIQNTRVLGSDRYDELMQNVSWWMNTKVWIGLFVTLLYPENLIFDRATKDLERQEKNAILSHVLLSRLALVRKVVLPLGENLFLILFILGLVFFIKSVGLF